MKQERKVQEARQKDNRRHLKWKEMILSEKKKDGWPGGEKERGSKKRKRRKKWKDRRSHGANGLLANQS